MRCETRLSVFNAAAAPATVSGEPVPRCHWVKPGKAVPGGDPRARRPTVDCACAGRGASAVFAFTRLPPAGPFGQTGKARGQTSPKHPNRAYALKICGRVTLADTAASHTTIQTARDAAAVLAPHKATASAITIFVCVTCRGGRPLDVVPVPGEVLAAATARAAEGSGIVVRPIRCLANCNRGLSAAVRRDGAWTYVFGNLDPVGGADALIEGAKLLAGTPDGLMPWRGRPEPLKRGLVARTPPFDFAGDCR
jgi:predicted metal-binding protein